MVGTSYDYSAPISESRTIGPKYHETKLFAQFLRVARDLTKVNLVRNSILYASNPAILTSELRNPDTNAGFYVTVHASSPSRDLTPFKLSVATTMGNLTIPMYAESIVLNGRESKIVVTDFALGEQKLVYSTAEVLTVSTQDETRLLFLWLPASESGEFWLSGVHSASLLKENGCSHFRVNERSAGLVISYTQLQGTCVVKFDNGYRVVLIDRSAAYGTWFPSTSSDPFTPEDSTVIVHGPYLVRSAAISGELLELEGDWTGSTSVEVFAASAVSRVSFNGKSVEVSRTGYGSLVGTLGTSIHTIESIRAGLPALTGWEVADGFPERLAEYDDSKWTVANHTSTPNPTKPATYPVLWADDYGYHYGALIYRGHFPSPSNTTTTTITGANISVIAGVNSGWSAFLNGVHVGSWPGSSEITQSSLSLSFANATLQANNVLTLLIDNMGHDQTSGATNPRGIASATLLGTATQTAPLFTEWKIAGAAGGSSNIDPIRGPYNEGELRIDWDVAGVVESRVLAEVVAGTDYLRPGWEDRSAYY
ncbi:hypothetical protein LZ554_006625 [Drepanopeziza brunnea f. sp. 'monogermtubi']|nr:hypothetical protein LZ554_006625 [Drepanopeziza brunnea f. sp. 'monogermtubi']